LKTYKNLAPKSKRLIATFLVLGAIISIGYFGTTSVFADDEKPKDILVQRIAEKFDLNESDVEAVFEAVKDEKIAEMEARREEKLSQAVSDGVITETQKNILLSKMKEHMETRKMNHEEMQAWFAEQGIDHEKLREYMGFKIHMRGGIMNRD
jgi:LPS sulfotransferase NodH